MQTIGHFPWQRIRFHQSYVNVEACMQMEVVVKCPYIYSGVKTVISELFQVVLTFLKNQSDVFNGLKQFERFLGQLTVD